MMISPIGDFGRSIHSPRQAEDLSQPAWQADPTQDDRVHLGSDEPTSLMGRMNQALARFGEKLGEGLVEHMRETREGLVQTQVPEGGPEREEYFLRQFLRQGEREFGKDSFHTLGQTWRYGMFCRHHGRPMETAQYFDKAVALIDRELVVRGDAADVYKVAGACAGEGNDGADIYAQAAKFFTLYGQNDKAVSLMEKAVALRLHAEAPVELQLEGLESLADHYTQANRPQDSLGCRQRALEMRLELSRPFAPETADAVDHLASAHLDAGDLATGETCRELKESLDSLEVFRKNVGSEARIMIPHYNTAAQAFRSLGHQEAGQLASDEADIVVLVNRVKDAGRRPRPNDLERLVALYRKLDRETPAFHAEQKLKNLRRG